MRKLKNLTVSAASDPCGFAMKLIAAKQRYLDLVEAYPLRPIRSERELSKAIKVVDSLLDRDTLNAAEEDYLDVLSDLVERYESESQPIDPVSDALMLAHLIEAKDVAQSAVAKATGIVNSTISEVLSGKRTLTRGQIGKLAKFFQVPPGVFAFDA